MAGYTNDRGMQIWRADESGNLIMPDLQSEFLDWLLADEKDPPTEKEWALEAGVPHGTVKKWKQDRRFKEMWERRSSERMTDPDRLQEIVGVLYQSAIKSRDIKAAKDYLLWAEKFLPPKEIKRDNSVAHMTDQQLRAEIEAILATGFGK